MRNNKPWRSFTNGINVVLNFIQKRVCFFIVVVVLQVKLASLDVNHRQECLVKTAELKHHVKELEKQVQYNNLHHQL